MSAEGTETGAVVSLDTDQDFLQLFEEPAGFRPPTPPPSSHCHFRPNISKSDSKNQPTEIHYNLIGHHSLWAHVAWNAGVFFANHLDAHPSLIQGKTVLELGAGAGLPSMVSAWNGARHVVCTDYPEKELIQNLRENIQHNCWAKGVEQIEAVGYLWGADCNEITQNLPMESQKKFDVIIMCDLVFNHSQHGQLLDTCQQLLADHSDARIYCVFTHHRPWMADRDLAILSMASEEPYGFQVKKVMEYKMKEMFQEDPGDVNVRQTVHFYELHRK